MLIGEYRHTLDAKKRLALPVKFRRELGRRVIITNGLDNCLFLYTEKRWLVLAERLANLSLGQAGNRGFNRFMLAGASETEVDGLGRILIPDFLKEFAGLEQKVVIAGLHDRVEIWTPERWLTHKTKVSQEVDTLAEKLGSIGAF